MILTSYLGSISFIRTEPNNPLNSKIDLKYTYFQFAPTSKHTPSRLYNNLVNVA
jgi:hypothetical protein